MICPHCKKPITRGLRAGKKALQKAKAFRAKGYSLRDIEKLLSEDGIQISYSHLSRVFRNEALK